MNEEMTKEEAAEIYNSIAKELNICFSSYYKYTFSFYGCIDDVEVTLSYGGSGDDVYRYNVDNKPFSAPKDFETLLQKYTSVYITKGKKTYSYYNQDY